MAGWFVRGPNAVACAERGVADFGVVWCAREGILASLLHHLQRLSRGAEARCAHVAVGLRGATAAPAAAAR
eukprot:scaffold523_cov446-Prasinococcus_capsulatus_cf.AAC.11